MAAAAPPSTVQAACALALAWLAGRDLSAAEIRLRLHRRGCPDGVIGGAIEELRRARAVDDERVAMSRARVESMVRGRGRERVLLRLRSIGIDADTARRAVDAVFKDVDEEILLDRALNRRLRPPTARIHTPAQYRRLFSALVRQGFGPAAVRKALDARRAKTADFPPDEGAEE